ncbi:MAG TPA: hypothetical protein VMR86_01545 [Myxococcota bacterium]|nr:hypothetical protein [Myxococcota bacterium]
MIAAAVWLRPAPEVAPAPAPKPRAAADAPPAPAENARPAAAAVVEPPAVAPPPPNSASRTYGASPAEIQLIGLEEEALRRIDVEAVLEAAGVDVHALKARPDAAEILRHVAADELMTRSYMRDYFNDTTFPYGYPTENATRDARAHAEGMIAQLTVEGRVESLTHDLESDDVEMPEPKVYPESSGRIWTPPSEQP